MCVLVCCMVLNSQDTEVKENVCYYLCVEMPAWLYSYVSSKWISMCVGRKKLNPIVTINESVMFYICSQRIRFTVICFCRSQFLHQAVIKSDQPMAKHYTQHRRLMGVFWYAYENLNVVTYQHINLSAKFYIGFLEPSELNLVWIKCLFFFQLKLPLWFYEIDVHVFILSTWCWNGKVPWFLFLHLSITGRKLCIGKTFSDTILRL